MARTQINLSKINGTGSVISAETFGTNYLFSSDVDKHYDDALILESNYLRYPGGSVSRNFDISNPDRTWSDTNGNGVRDKSDKDLLPLDDFLVEARAIGASVNFVFSPGALFDPEHDFSDVHNHVFTPNCILDADGENIVMPQAQIEAIKDEIKDFVLNRLLNNPEGVRISTIEIGNEEWGSGEYDNWLDSVRDLGVRTALVATAVQEAIEEWDGPYTPRIVVPYMPNNPMTTGEPLDSSKDPDKKYDWAGTSAQDAFFDGMNKIDGALETISGLQFHTYYYEGGLGGDYTARYNTIEKRFADFLKNDIEQTKSIIDNLAGTNLSKDFKIEASEWGMLLSDQTHLGLKAVPYFTEMASEMLEAGVDFSNTWYWNGGPAALVDHKGNLRPIGAIYKSMNENLLRTQAIDENLSKRDSKGNYLSDIHIFANDAKYVAYLHNMTDESQSYRIDFSDIVNRNFSFSGELIGVGEGIDPTAMKAIAEVTGVSLEQIKWDNGIATIELNPYETIALRFDMDTVFKGTSYADILHGENGNDTLLGGAGWDQLNGSGGADVIKGEHGDDLVYGGAGRDKGIGGQGDDVIFGGIDGDILQGDSGDDYLVGDEGDDILRGGDGSDALFGGLGNDTLSLGKGGEGVQRASGGDGDDKYIISSDSGDSFLYGELEDGGQDTVSFLDQNFEDLSFEFDKDSGSLKIFFETSAGRQSVEINSPENFEQFEFANGTEMSVLHALQTSLPDYVSDTNMAHGLHDIDPTMPNTLGDADEPNLPNLAIIEEPDSS